MRKEDLFEIIGELDDNFVKAAGTPVKNRINWKAVGTMAACFAVMCIAIRGFSLTGFHSSMAPAETAMPPETWEEAPMEEAPMAEAPAEEAPAASMEEENTEAVPAEEAEATVEESEAFAGDLESMVYVNDILYRLLPDQEIYQEQEEEFIYLGEIESAVSSDSIPKQNLQANDPLIGCEVYQYGKNIVVKMDDIYLLYEIYGEP